MALPTAKSQPVTSFDQMTTLLYGPTKIGKSTWCSNAPGVLFLATEPGLNHLAVHKVDIASWEQFIETCKEIDRAEHDFKTVVIDTIDIAYKLCTDHFLKKYGVDYENDGTLSYGKGAAMIRNEFQRVLLLLGRLPTGLVLISHSREIEIETRTGKQAKTVPTLPEKMKEVVLGMVDLVLYCDVESEVDEDGVRTYNRVIRTKHTPQYEAGDRTGRLPETLPLDFKEFEKCLKPPSRRASERHRPGHMTGIRFKHSTTLPKLNGAKP